MSLPGTNTLLMGPGGTGKTHAIQTYLEAGITPYVLFTEQGMETIGGIEGIHWCYISPASASWQDMLEVAQKINQLSFDMLSKLGGINKHNYGQLLQVLSMCMDFVDQHGQHFGDVSQWGTDRAFIIDGLGGISTMAMDLTIGGKPVRSQPDWQIAMDQVERLIQKWCLDSTCHFCLIAHIEPERDEISGAVKNMASTLGRRLAPKLPKFFSDVILTKRLGTTFNWSTDDAQTDTKARNVPISANIPPSFVPLINKWKERGGVIQAERVQATYDEQSLGDSVSQN